MQVWHQVVSLLILFFSTIEHCLPAEWQAFSFASIADKKERSEKRTKTESSEDTSAKPESLSPQKTPTSKNGGKNSSNYWLMKSEPESRLEKGVDVKVRLCVCPIMLAMGQWVRALAEQAWWSGTTVQGEKRPLKAVSWPHILRHTHLRLKTRMNTFYHRIQTSACCLWRLQGGKSRICSIYYH